METINVQLGQPLSYNLVAPQPRNPNSYNNITVDWQQVVQNPIVQATATCLTNDLTLSPPVCNGMTTYITVSGAGTMGEYSLIQLQATTTNGNTHTSVIKILTEYSS